MGKVKISMASLLSSPAMPSLPPKPKKAFNPETFPSMPVSEQLDCLTETMLNEVTLDEPEQSVSVHVHPLVKHAPDTDNGWNCDKLTGANKCLSGLTGFYQSKDVVGYRCALCNYDLCVKCMKADLIIQMNGVRED